VGRVTPSGTVTELGVPNGGDSGGIVSGPEGKLWFTQPLHNKITSLTPGSQFKDFAIPTANSGPFAITVGPDGNLWFTESAAEGNKIGRLTAAGVFTEFPIPTPNANARGIALGPDGNVWFTELDGRKIGRITPAGAITEFGIPNAASPGSITPGPDGNLWFTEPGSANSIGRVTPEGSIAEYLIPTAAADPSGIVAGPDGNLWFSELSANKIGKLGNLKGGGNVPSSSGMGGGGPLTDPKTCKDDTDCLGSGKACGGDVCNADHRCVLAISADPGTCSSDDKCWCKAQGAKCDGTSHRCSFVVHGGDEP
jgi:streptogramin lyase